MRRDKFAKNFAAWLTLFGCVYVTAYTFVPWAKSDDAQMILGFVMGTMLSTAIYWSIGTSKSSSDKTDMANEKESK